MLPEVSVSLRMRSTDSVELSRKVEKHNERYLLSLTAREGAKRVSEVTAWRDDLWLLLNYYRVCN